MNLFQTPAPVDRKFETAIEFCPEESEPEGLQGWLGIELGG